ncbi:MAG: TIGR00730 family Rossman fold protein [Prevotella sp.]
MKIGIFCSANANIDPDFFKLTEELGQWAGSHKHTIVFGGCNMGLMECVAKATREAGGTTIGVIPQIIERGGKSSDNVDITIPCDNLSDRKDLLLAHSDIVVALPGGIGTLDEVFTVAAAATIGYHSKKVILYNIKDFWSPLINLLDKLQENSMIRGDWHHTIQVADNLECLQKTLLATT